MAAAICFLQSGKSPGPDGFSSDLNKSLHFFSTQKRIKTPWIFFYSTVMLKFQEKFFNSRLEDVLPTIVFPDQTGFIKNCQPFFHYQLFT